MFSLKNLARKVLMQILTKTGKTASIFWISHCYDEKPDAGKTVSLYWNGPLVISIEQRSSSTAVDKPKFMDRPPDHPWWRTGLPELLLGYSNYVYLSLKSIFLVINTKFAWFLFNHVPTYQELGRPSGDFRDYVGSPDQVMGRIWRLGDLLSTALFELTVLSSLV